MNENDLRETAAVLHAMELVPDVKHLSYELLLKILEERVNDLINTDFDRLVQILYRMDVPEQKLRQTLDRSEGSGAAQVTASMMIDRELQKIESRRKFRGPDDIPAADKW